MRRTADVRSIDALREAKAALADFRESATVALSEASSEVQRTLGWLQTDRRMYWESQVRRREQLLSQARSDLERAKISAMDERASCHEQRKALERAERALEEARHKVERVRHWSRVLDREMMLFKGKLQGMARTVESELPRGEAHLDGFVEQLERYVRTAAEPAATPRPASSESGSPTETETGPVEPAEGDDADG